MFDKFVIQKNQVIPPVVNLQGAVAFSRDTNHVGTLHKFFYYLQNAYYTLHRLNACDPNLCHGMVFLNKGFKDKTVLIAHSVFKGILTSDRDYLKDPDLTQLLIYVPKDAKTRAIMVKFANQTSRNPRTQAWKKHTYMPFSLKDLILSLFHSGDKPNRRKMRRTALATADLIQGHFINNRRDKPKGLFCTPYAMTLLQSASIVSKLDAAEEQQLKIAPRKEAAKLLYEWLSDKNHALGKEFRNNKLWQYDTRYGMSGTAAALLDTLSAQQ
jgi:hypothetical protein